MECFLPPFLFDCFFYYHLVAIPGGGREWWESKEWVWFVLVVSSGREKEREMYKEKKKKERRRKKEGRKLAKVVLEEGRRRKRESLVVQLLQPSSFRAISFFSLSISFQPKRSSSVYERACSAWREGRKCLLQREREGEREERTLQLILTEAAASNVLKRLSLPLPHFLFLSLPLASWYCVSFLPLLADVLHCYVLPLLTLSLPLPCQLASSPPLPHSSSSSLSLSNQKNQPQPTRPDLFSSHFSLILLSTFLSSFFLLFSIILLSLSSLLSSFLMSHPSLILPPSLSPSSCFGQRHDWPSLSFSPLSLSFSFFLSHPTSFPSCKHHPYQKLTQPLFFSLSLFSSSLSTVLSLPLFQSSLSLSLFLSSNPHSLVKLFLLSLPLSIILFHITYLYIFAEAEHGYASTFIPASHDDDLMQTKRGGRIHHNSTSSSVGSGSGININNNKDKQQQRGGSKLNKKSQGNRYIILSLSFFHLSLIHIFSYLFFILKHFSLFVSYFVWGRIFSYLKEIVS